MPGLQNVSVPWEHGEEVGQGVGQAGRKTDQAGNRVCGD